MAFPDLLPIVGQLQSEEVFPFLGRIISDNWIIIGRPVESLLFNPGPRSLAMRKQKRTAVFIGPEGGFSEREIEYAVKTGAREVSLGNRILRTETAAVLASGMLTCS